MATIVPLARFDTPGALRDLPPDSGAYAAWHRTIERLIRDRVKLSGTGRSVDPSKVDVEVSARRVYTWTGFSRPLMAEEHRDDRRAAFEAGENRKVQIEYLEWHVTRRAGKIVKVVFVTETPEYWKWVAAADKAKVLETCRAISCPASTRTISTSSSCGSARSRRLGAGCAPSLRN